MIKIKTLNWHPYINNNDVDRIFGQIAHITDDDNNILYYYLIIYPIANDEQPFHLMIAGRMVRETFTYVNDAQDWAEQHFNKFIKSNINDTI